MAFLSLTEQKKMKHNHVFMIPVHLDACGLRQFVITAGWLGGGGGHTNAINRDGPFMEI